MNHVGSSVNLHIIMDGKILLMRRISQRWMGGKLQIPGGHVDQDESPLGAALREANEELGISIDSDDIRHISTAVVKDDQTEYFALQFQLIKPRNYTFRIAEREKCSELVWAELHQLPDDTIDLFKVVIEQTHIRKQTYIEIGY